MDAERRDKVPAFRFSQSKKSWTKTSLGQRLTTGVYPSTLKLVTWNIDFMSEYVTQRAEAALRHIQRDVLHCRDGQQPPPCAILLQEVHAQALDSIASNSWVQEHFVITPVAPVYSSRMPRIFFAQQWPPADWLYGNVTLVSRTVPVVDVINLVYLNSEMDRNALIVDLMLSTPDPGSLVVGSADRTGDAKIGDEGSIGEEEGGDNPRRASPGKGKGKSRAQTIILRVGNTHLESLAGHGTIVRPFQMRLIARALQQNIHGGIVCGDMNTIEDSDKASAVEAGLADAYTLRRLGGAGIGDVPELEDESAGFTWGYQPPSEFPPNRLDKMLYTANETFRVERPEMIGVNVRIEQKDLWASDHYGLETAVHILQQSGLGL